MMEGIYVLNTIEEMGFPSWWWALIVIIFCLGSIAGIAWSIFKKDWNYFKLAIGVSLAAIFIYMSVLPKNTPSGNYTYQATIQDNVDFKEFYGKYRVIKQEGEIYYIREKSK